MFLKSIGLLAGTAASALLAAGTAAAQDPAPDTASEVIITGYRASAASTATKALEPLVETPQAVSVVTNAVLQDQSALTIEDALRNVAGASVGGHYRGIDSVRLRGFDATRVHQDGLPTVGGVAQRLFGVERVEVVKGPASDLYGQGSPGGLVNLVSKAPTREAFARGALTLGSWNFIEPEIDVNHVLSDAVAARLSVVVRENETFVDYTDEQRLFVAPSLRMDLSSDTSLTLLARYQREKVRPGVALPASGTIAPNPNGEIPIERYIGFPDAPRSLDVAVASFGWQGRHQLANGWTLRQAGRVETYDRERGVDWKPALLCDAVAAFLLGCAADRDLLRYPEAIEDQFSGVFTDTSLAFDAGWGGVAHSLVAGVETGALDARRLSQTSDLLTPNVFAFRTLDLFAPVYGASPANLQLEPGLASQSDSRQLGLYVRDHINVGKWGVALGARFDRATVKSGGGKTADEAFSPSLGVTYQLEGLGALYANASRSFNPKADLFDAGGDPLAPEEGENFEVGLKLQTPEGRLSGLVSVYDLTRQNVAVYDVTTPGAYRVGGEQRSRGLEIEGQFRLTPATLITAAYAYTDAKITDDTYLPVGEPVAAVPQNATRLWLRHTLESGLGFGLGISTYDDQRIYYANVLTGALQQLTLPSYTVVDAAVFYRTDDWAVQLNVNNVTDERYFPAAFSDAYVLPGAPLNARVRLSKGF